jgi:hypothetical protein
MSGPNFNDSQAPLRVWVLFEDEWMNKDCWTYQEANASRKQAESIMGPRCGGVFLTKLGEDAYDDNMRLNGLILQEWPVMAKKGS